MALLTLKSHLKWSSMRAVQQATTNARDVFRHIGPCAQPNIRAALVEISPVVQRADSLQTSSTTNM